MLSRGSLGSPYPHHEGSRTLDISPWPITQLRTGGVAVVAAADGVRASTGSIQTSWLCYGPTRPGQTNRLHLGERGRDH